MVITFPKFWNCGKVDFLKHLADKAIQNTNTISEIPRHRDRKYFMGKG